jgi:outer membrane murein-binding lipoprotein Lpp
MTEMMNPAQLNVLTQNLVTLPGFREQVGGIVQSELQVYGTEFHGLVSQVNDLGTRVNGLNSQVNGLATDVNSCITDLAEYRGDTHNQLEKFRTDFTSGISELKETFREANNAHSNMLLGFALVLVAFFIYFVFR